MSQLSQLFDENAEAYLNQDTDVRGMLELIQNPNMNANQNCSYPLVQQSFNLPFPQLPLPIPIDMPNAEQLPTSVAANTVDRVNKEEFVGEYNFEVIIDPHHGSKSPWVYSNAMKKVFILINAPFPVDVKVTPRVGKMLPELFLRVTPSYGSAQDSLTFVKRCLQHMQPNFNHDVSEEIWEHIIRCQNVNACYNGGKNIQSHLSVLVPLGQAQNGNDSIRNMFQFVCKNSCTSGMNRRMLDIVFTLEDQCCNVLGRVTMSVKICSCPKRDKEKEEKEYHKRESPLPPTKRRKAEKRPLSTTQTNSDLTEYDLSVRIPGKHNFQAIVKYIHDLMAGEMLRNRTEAPYRRTLDDIKQYATNAE